MTSLPYADGYTTNLLLGIDINKSFEIYPGVQLVRIEDLPDSNSKDHYLGDDSKWHFNNPHSEMIGKPKCALVKKIRIEPVWSKNSSVLRYQYLNIYCSCHNVFVLWVK